MGLSYFTPKITLLNHPEPDAILNYVQGDKTDEKKKCEERRGVSWATDTVDNEHMNKKKSKCCCIYVKPKKFGESDTESSEGDDDCEHCPGHKKTGK